MKETAAARPVPSPRHWVRLALFGAFVYLASQVMQLYPSAASQATGLSTANLAAWLPVLTGTGLVFLFAGLVAGFWRVNRVAGHTGAGVAGLVGGTLGVFVLAALDLLGIFGALGFHSALLTAVGNDATLGPPLGTFLAFSGLALLGVGLVHALWISAPAPAEETSDAGSELGSSGYRSY